jgi:hypothetical protein
MMTHSEAPISITVKSAAGSLVTLRASTAEELDQVVALSLASLTAATTELEAAIRGANTAVPPQPQTAAIATAFGGAIISETANTYPAQEYAPSQGARMCPHGAMTRIHGLTGKFGPYKGHFCPAPQGAQNKCTTQYIKQGQPGWDTFIADQTKA